MKKSGKLFNGDRLSRKLSKFIRLGDTKRSLVLRRPSDDRARDFCQQRLKRVPSATVFTAQKRELDIGLGTRPPATRNKG